MDRQAVILSSADGEEDVGGSAKSKSEKGR